MGLLKRSTYNPAYSNQMIDLELTPVLQWEAKGGMVTSTIKNEYMSLSLSFSPAGIRQT